MAKQKGKIPWILIIILIWLIIVLGGYYYVHKPFSPDKLAPAVYTLTNLLFVPLILLLFGGLGRRILPLENIQRAGRLVLQFGLGTGLFSLVWFLLGLAGLYFRWTAWGVLLLGLFFLRKPVYSWAKEFSFMLLEFEKIKKSEKAVVLFLSVLLLIQLLIALSPPLKYDALTYHLDLPRHYAAANSFVFLDQNPYWGHPQLVEVLYTFAYLLFGLETAVLLGWVVGVMILAGTAGVCNFWIKEADPKADTKMPGLMAAAVLLSGYTFRYMFSWAYTDLFSVLFGFCTLLVFIQFLQTNNVKFLYFSGLFAGFALGTKWTAALVLLPLFFWLVPDLLKGRLKPRTVFIWGGVFFLTALPWFLKNYIYTGNPLYPYFFPTPWINDFRLTAASTSPQNHNLVKNLLAPLTSTWFGVDSATGFGADIGPLMLLFLPFVFWKFRREKIVKLFGLCLLFWWGSMLLGSHFFEHLQQTRLYFVFLPCLAICAALGWYAVQPLKSGNIRVGLVLNGMLFMVSVFILFQDITDVQVSRSIAYLGGNSSRQDYLEKSLGWYARAMKQLEGLPAGSKVLMLWEGRGLYAPDNVDSDPWIDVFRVNLSENLTTQEMIGHWQEEGYSYLLVNMSGVEFLQENPGSGWQEDWQAFDALLDGLPEPLSMGDVYSLYELPLLIPESE